MYTIRIRNKIINIATKKKKIIIRRACKNHDENPKFALKKEKKKLPIDRTRSLVCHIYFACRVTAEPTIGNWWFETRLPHTQHPAATRRLPFLSLSLCPPSFVFFIFYFVHIILLCAYILPI